MIPFLKFEEMTWNNRIFRHQQEVRPGKFDTYYTIHEAFYDDKGKLDNWTENAIEAYGETPQELIDHLKQMLNDAEKSKDDILDYDELERKSKP